MHDADKRDIRKKNTERSDPEWKVIVSLLSETNPILMKRLGRKMMNYLFKRNVKKMSDVMERLLVYSPDDYETGAAWGENQPMPRINHSAIEFFTSEVFRIAEEELSSSEISAMLTRWLRYESTRFLSILVEQKDVPLVELSAALDRFSLLPESHKVLDKEESMGIRVALIRRLFSTDLTYINTTKNRVRIIDFIEVLDHTIGPATGSGRLGGKAAGLFRAKKILESYSARKDNVVLRNLKVPKTWYISSDAIFEFIHHNALEELLSIKYSDPDELRKEYSLLRQIFKSSLLPAGIMSGLNVALDQFGNVPLVVRSSSLLEDSVGSAFAGKYKSLFVANVGSKMERLEALADAIMEVYASVFSPDPIEYRRERGLLDFNEEMGIIIQEVVGKRVGKYYFPAFAGVAFSRNEFRWSPRIRREDGIVRLVTGLGTRAVDRTGQDFPMLLCPGQPGLRVNVTPEETIRYAQKHIDVINLENRRFETVLFDDLVKAHGSSYPVLSYIISLYKDGNLSPPMGSLFNVENEETVITFSRLLSRSPFPLLIQTILQILEKEIGVPVDVEFAYADDIQVPYLLQCRPQSYSGEIGEVVVPDDVPEEDIVFTAGKYITSGICEGIEFVVYVDPVEYDRLESLEELIEVGHVVGRLNKVLPQRKFILIGPGRWGSRGDIKLGVKVGYADINNTAMLIEVARMKKGYMPDLSFGTHFFQDLVEAGIIYLPLYPDEPGIIFNEDFFMKSRNRLCKLVPGAKHLAKQIKVVQVSMESDGASLSVVMDGNTDSAIGYLTR